MINFLFDDYFILKIWASKISSEVSNSGVIVTVTSFGTIDAHELSAYSLLKLKSNYGILKGLWQLRKIYNLFSVENFYNYIENLK